MDGQTRDSFHTLAPHSQFNDPTIQSALQRVRQFLQRKPAEIAVLFLTSIASEEQGDLRAVQIEKELIRQQSKLESIREVFENPSFQMSHYFEEIGLGSEGEAELVRDLFLHAGVSSRVASIIKEIYLAYLPERGTFQEPLGPELKRHFDELLEPLEQLRRRNQVDVINPLAKDKLDLPHWREVQVEGRLFKFRHVKSFHQRLPSSLEVIYYKENGEEVLFLGDEALRWVRENIWLKGLGKTLVIDGIPCALIRDQFQVFPSGWIEDKRVIKILLGFFRYYQGGNILSGSQFRAIRAIAQIPDYQLDFLRSRHFWAEGPPDLPKGIEFFNAVEGSHRFDMEMHHWYFKKNPWTPEIFRQADDSIRSSL